MVWPGSRGPESVTWTSYFIVVETLEEKQVHLVKQVVGRFVQLKAKASSEGAAPSQDKPLHPAWILALYSLFFQHQNSAVAKWGLEHLLTDENSWRLVGMIFLIYFSILREIIF